MNIQTNIRCPACQGALLPTELHCDVCDVSIAGRFVPNEFSSLGEDDLHFLRIFVLCEGRIRDMESALGVSYPTIKARLAKLKESLATPQAQTAQPQGLTTATVLRDLEAGRISYDQAMALLKGLSPQKDITHEK